MDASHWLTAPARNKKGGTKGGSWLFDVNIRRRKLMAAVSPHGIHGSDRGAMVGGRGGARGTLGSEGENVWGEKGKRGALWGLQAFIWGLGKQLPLPACTA